MVYIRLAHLVQEVAHVFNSRTPRCDGVCGRVVKGRVGKPARCACFSTHYKTKSMPGSRVFLEITSGDFSYGSSKVLELST